MPFARYINLLSVQLRSYGELFRCRLKLKFHGTDTDTDILADFRARILARLSVRDARVHTCKRVLYCTVHDKLSCTRLHAKLHDRRIRVGVGPMEFKLNRTTCPDDAVRRGSISKVQPPRECFRSGAGDGFVVVSATSEFDIQFPISILYSNHSSIMQRFRDRGMGETDGRMDGRTDSSIA